MKEVHKSTNIQDVPTEKVSRTEEKENKKSTNSNHWQLIAAITASFSAASIGIGHSWTSPVLPYLKSNSSELPITETEGIWIATIFDIGSLCAGVFLPMLASLVGRKYFLLHSTILQVISWILIIFAKNIITICIARFIYGLAAITAMNFALMYIGEIAEKNIRGRLIFMIKIITSSAHLTVKTAGAFLSFKMMNVTMLCLILPVILIIPFIPESPYYLLLRDRKEEALESLMKLRGRTIPESVNSELVRVKNTVKESQENKEWAYRELFFVKGNRKSLYVVLVVSMVPFMSGKVTISAHTQEILSYSEFALPPKESTVVLGVIEVITFTIGSFIIECFGRRKLFLIYAILTWLSSVILGLFFFAQIYLLVDLKSISWFLFAGLIFYLIAMNLGLFSIHYVLLGEMLGFKVKATATSLTMIICDITILSNKAVFDLINSVAGIYANFWMYAVFCFIGTIIFYIIAPETKGKTLEEIQAIFHSDK